MYLIDGFHLSDMAEQGSDPETTLTEIATPSHKATLFYDRAVSQSNTRYAKQRDDWMNERRVEEFSPLFKLILMKVIKFYYFESDKNVMLQINWRISTWMYQEDKSAL